MAKVEEKKNNKAIIITLSICLSVVVIIVLLLTLIDPIVGASKMKKARDAAESCDEIVISAPLYKDSFIQGAEVIISDGEAKELANIFLSAAEKASYDESFEGLGGFWDTKLEFYSSGARCSIYLKDDEVYVAKDTKGYIFEIDDDREEIYEELLYAVDEILSNSKR